MSTFDSVVCPPYDNGGYFIISHFILALPFYLDLWSYYASNFKKVGRIRSWRALLLWACLSIHPYDIVSKQSKEPLELGSCFASSLELRCR